MFLYLIESISYSPLKLHNKLDGLVLKINIYYYISFTRNKKKQIRNNILNVNLSKVSLIKNLVVVLDDQIIFIPLIDVITNKAFKM